MMNPKTSFELNLYLVLNPHQCTDQSPVETALMAAKGGADAVQIRSKNSSSRELLKLTQNLSKTLAPHQIPLFINDYVDIAKSAPVDGIHLGQDDMPVSQARNILGQEILIGLTVRSALEAKGAPLEHLDYISIGGIFSTKSKRDSDAPIGVSSLKEILKIIRKRNQQLPVIAISGINHSNLEAVLRTGVDGIAVVSAICESKNPYLATRKLKEQIMTIKHRFSTA